MRYNLFHGEKVKLSVVREEDAEVMVKWGEDSEYLRNVDTEFAYPKTKEEYAEEGKSGSSSVYFRLRTIEDDRLVGFVAIHGIEWNNRAANIAIGIGEASDRNKGYGTDALKLILRYAFHELNLDRVGLDVIDYNKRGIKAYENVGFQLEGKKRSMVYRDGQRYDVILMSILRDEWEEIYSK
ncbi:GNAT family N-acetyltransferase [Cytobacillus sp. FJAT-54145]|uniref:GNAT family N-acetyltransferase n=1 Tax=Cytobacillus spartinae TaxID=3299023 RepID=A0ABW6K6N0_9BACI